MSLKVRTARLSIFSNTLLIILKLVVGLISGSVSIISEAIHSLLDLLAALIAFFSVRISDIPPDVRHPYGHGKFENISAVVEALLIFVAAAWIIYEAVSRLLHPSRIEFFGLGIFIMFISATVNIFVSRRLYKAARLTDSIALKADALHLSMDVYTSFGVGLGLMLIWLTGYQFLDPAIAILVALFILRESYLLLKTAYLPLLDVSLSDEDILLIHDSIRKHLGEGMGFHQLRTRKSGSFRYIDMHLELEEQVSVKEAHRICDLIENEIKRHFKKTEVIIHVEPFLKTNA